MSNRLQLLDPTWATHLTNQLSSGDAQRAKHALQDICKMYRAGRRFRPDSLPGIEIAVVGLLATRHSDPKLRRWSLNAIAQIGRKEFCLSQTLDIFRRYEDDPETVTSAVAAIYKMTGGKTGSIAGLSGADQKLVFLSALQSVPAERLLIPPVTVSIEHDHPDIVKAATILVGLNKAPPNLFDPVYENSVLLKALGGHGDPLVSQYSVWAIAENPQLGFRDLGIHMRAVDDQQSNVRSWMYRLLGMSEGELANYREIVELGMADNAEVKLGLAIGIRDSFQDWLEPQVIDWHLSEPDDHVRNMLLDHIVRQSNRATTYSNLATQLYTSEPAGSAMRKRMEANALGLPLYQKLKAIEYQAQPNDLFSVGGPVTNITINGGVQGGAVSLTGNATNPGSSQIHYQPQTIEAIRSELSRALVELEKLDDNVPSREEAIVKVREAQAEPTQDRLGAAARIVTHVSEGLTKVAGAGGALASSGQALLELWSKLPL